MKFTIFLDNKNDILEEDASLCYGHFKLEENEVSVSFFEEKSCMIFLTLVNFLSFLKSKKEKNQWFYNWIGEGNGRRTPIRRKGKVITFYEKKEYSFDFFNFEKIVVQSVNEFLEKCKTLNPEIVNESAFKALKNRLI